MILVGDIGGTKTDLAVFASDGNLREPIAQAEFHSSSYPGLDTMVREFLRRVTLPVDIACFGVPGPVIEGRVRTTNLPWILEEQSLVRELGLTSVELINDLEAIARAIPLLHSDEKHTLNPGESVGLGSIAVIAPGTGLGEAYLVWDGTRYRARSSEGGHCDYAPTNELEIGLLRYMLERFDHVSYEHVCSGVGIANIYRCLRDIGYAPESPRVAAQIASAPDPNVVITSAALDADSPDRLCAATVDLFVSILGAEAGNLALKVLATGGVYVGGGMPAHVLPVLDNGTFMKAFRRKGRLADLVANIPVHVITSRAAMIGAADRATELARSLHQTE